MFTFLGANSNSSLWVINHQNFMTRQLNQTLMRSVCSCHLLVFDETKSTHTPQNKVFVFMTAFDLIGPKWSYENGKRREATSNKRGNVMTWWTRRRRPLNSGWLFNRSQRSLLKKERSMWQGGPKMRSLLWSLTSGQASFLYWFPHLKRRLLSQSSIPFIHFHFNASISHTQKTSENFHFYRRIT